MSAETTWYEQNGTATGTPAHGTETAISACDWKSADDTTTSRTAAPVLAGENSYDKYIYLKFGGSFNRISSVKFAHTAGTMGTGITLLGAPTSTYATPATTAITATDITAITAIDSGADVNLSSTGPNGTAASSCTINPCYTQYIHTQVKTTSSAGVGDSQAATLTIKYNEN